jgi:phage tail sheath protein FI
MPEYLSPGVYIEEMDLGPVPIQGVATSTGGIIGLCQRGPSDTPTLITSLGQFTSTFGGPLPPNATTTLNANFNNVAYGVQGFFNNGGTMLYVIRVAPNSATYWSEQYQLQNAGGISLILQASDAGSWANAQFGVLYGRYQQTDGLSITFTPESNIPYSVQAGSTLTSVNLSSTAGLYIGAVVAWSPSTNTYVYGVVSGLSDNSITLTNVPFTAAPPAGATLTLVEFTLSVNFLQGAQVTQSETWHHLNLNGPPPSGPTASNPGTANYIGTIVGNISPTGSSPGASSLIRAGLSGAGFIDFNTVGAYILPPGAPSQVPPSQSNVTATSTTVTGLTDGIAYDFSVAGLNAAGAGPESAEVEATPQTTSGPPGPPPGFVATGGDNEVTVSWNLSPGATSYTVYEGTAPPGGTVVYTGAETSATITSGILNGTSYTFYVTASNAASPPDSAPSGPASATPKAPTSAPPQPTGLVATPGDTQVVLTWAPTPTATTYDVFQSATSGGEGSTPVLTGITSTTATITTSLTNGTASYFTVAGLNSASPDPGPQSAEVSAVPNPATIPPPTPTGLTANPFDGQVALEWSASPGATSYDIYISTPGDDGLSTITTAAYNALFNAATLDTDDPATRGGIYAFQNIRGMMMISMPGNTDPGVQADLLALCQNDGYKFAMLDPAPTDDPTDWHVMDAATSDIITQRGNYDSEYGALYYPWINIEDPSPPNPNNVGTVNLSPSGFQMGITARVDINRGVFKAPANEIVQGAVSFSHPIDQGTQDVLNPLGINCYRDFRAENYGLRIWGARTVSSNGQWKYVSIRRLFQYIEASIQYGTEWVVFEPNNSITWARVRQSVTDFLTDTWRSGALMGAKPSEAFYVTCDFPDTMTMSDVENGRLICEIGIAPTFPAEFVIFQISQWTGSAQGS